LYEELIKEGFDIKYIDLGGGLGIKYQPDQANPEPEDLAKAIMPSLRGSKLSLFWNREGL